MAPIVRSRYNNLMKEEILCKVQMQIASIVQSQYLKKNNIMKSKNMMIAVDVLIYVDVITNPGFYTCSMIK